MGKVRNVKAWNGKAEALWSLRANGGLNAQGGQAEHAYSPAFNSHGKREAGSNAPYRVCNVNDPGYGRAESIHDWVSVGVERPRRGWHWRKVGGLWMQYRNVRGKRYTVNAYGYAVEA